MKKERKNCKDKNCKNVFSKSNDNIETFLTTISESWLTTFWYKLYKEYSDKQASTHRYLSSDTVFKIFKIFKIINKIQQFKKEVMLKSWIPKENLPKLIVWNVIVLQTPGKQLDTPLWQ